MKQIRVLDNRGQEYLLPLDKPVMEVSIGRSQNNDIVLNSKTVSRRHAIIKLMGERVMLVNQSANGVFVNGERVERVRELRLGEYAAIEPYRFCVEPAGPGAVPSPSPAGYGPGNDRPTIPPMGRAAPVSSPAPAAVRPASQAAVATASRPERRPVAPRERKKAAESVEELLGDLAPNPDYQEQRVSLRGDEVIIHNRKIRDAFIGFKSELHDELKERLDLHSFQITDYSSPRVIRQVSEKLKELISRRQREIPQPYTPDEVFKEMMDEVCGLGPIEDLVKHKGVSEIMVVDREHIYAELNGKIVLTDRIFNDEKSMMTVIERIVIRRGRRIDESNPLVDTRLADGSRVNAVIPPLALKDPCLMIRKFPDERFSVKDLIDFGSLTDEMAKFLARAVRSKKNIIISGGTGSGKTTLLNVLSGFI